MIKENYIEQNLFVQSLFILQFNYKEHSQESGHLKEYCYSFKINAIRSIH